MYHWLELVLQLNISFPILIVTLTFMYIVHDCKSFNFIQEQLQLEFRFIKRDNENQIYFRVTKLYFNMKLNWMKCKQVSV